MKSNHTDELRRDSLRFLKLATYEEAYEKIRTQFANYNPRVESARVDLARARVSAEDVRSKVDIPSRTITAMDGYAVIQADLKTASLSSPRYLSVKGSIFVEHGSELPVIHHNEAYYVATGAPLPKGSDTVVRVEEASQDGNRGITVRRVIPKGKDVAIKGEDIQKGAIVIRKGRVLTPTDVALLIGVGRTHIRANKNSTVGLLSIGNELREFDPGRSLKQEEGRTVNNYLNLLFGYLEQLNSKPLSLGICGDGIEEIQQRILKGLKRCDMILTISGSSVGRHDNVLGALKAIPGSKVLFHGVRVVPIKPCGVVMVRGKPVLIIPGHAVSSLLTFFTFAFPILNSLSGLPMDARKDMVSARAVDDIVNERSIDALCLVKVEVDSDGNYGATPLDWGSNLVSNLAKADGFVWLGKKRVISKGDAATVRLFNGYVPAKSV